MRQVSPESPVKSLVQEMPGIKEDTEAESEDEGGKCSTFTLQVPVLRTRKNSDASRPNPRSVVGSSVLAPQFCL